MDNEKKHKEEVVRATQLWECGDITRENLEYIFPELKESEEERIRTGLINGFKECLKKSNYPKNTQKYWHNIKIEDILAWLEKQGERKTVDNVEPKFKVGDWITDGYCKCQITFIDSSYWYSETCVLGDVESIDKNYHLWTIVDAKEGDVLWHSDSASNGIFIFKEIRHDGKVLCYCDYDSEDHFCNGEYHTCCWSNDKYIKPATKEQRDHLFEKIHEAGYEWDADKKELKKIEEEYNGEDYGIDSLFHAQRILEKTLGKVNGYQTDDGILSHKCAITAVKKLYEKKSTKWTEEDDDNLNMAIYFMRSENTPYSPTDVEPVVEWLCGLKQRREE